MDRKKGILISFLIMFIICSLYADKTLERIALELYKEGEDLYNSGKSVEAAKTFESAIAKLREAVTKDGIPLDNKKITYWMELAFNGYLKGKDFENALRTQNERIKLNQGNYELISTKAKLLKKYLNRIDEAIIVLKNYNNKKRSFKVEKKIGLYYSDLKDYENALIWYKKAYKLKKDSKVIKNIANLYIKLGKNTEAIKAYEGFILTNPKESVLAQTYKNMGSLYEDLKNMPKAIEYYEKSLKMKYDNNIVLLLATKYYDNDAYDKALEKIILLLKNKPGNSDAIYYRAMIEYNRDEKDAAKADFQLLLKDPKYGKVAKGFIESIKSE